MNDNFENDRNNFIGTIKKNTDEMDCSQTMNERNEKIRTCPSLFYILPGLRVLNLRNKTQQRHLDYLIISNKQRHLDYLIISNEQRHLDYLIIVINSASWII